MDVSQEYPHSPAYSDCDSLAGIDDLDAFLDAQGKLSQWPTPPLRRELEEDLEVPSEESEDESEDGIDDLDVATVFAREIGLDGARAWDDVLLLEELFIRAQLHIEVLALSFNIVSKLVKQQHIDALLEDMPLDLLILSTLSLSSIHTHDHPPSVFYLARNVSVTAIMGKQIDNASIAIMSALDWRIHDCSEGVAIAQTLRLFERREPPRYVPNLAHGLYDEPYLKPQPLCLKVADHSHGEVHWSNGLLTPGVSSTNSVVPEFENSFLPLL